MQCGYKKFGIKQLEYIRAPNTAKKLFPNQLCLVT